MIWPPHSRWGCEKEIFFPHQMSETLHPKELGLRIGGGSALASAVLVALYHWGTGTEPSPKFGVWQGGTAGLGAVAAVLALPFLLWGATHVRKHADAFGLAIAVVLLLALASWNLAVTSRVLARKPISSNERQVNAWFCWIVLGIMIASLLAAGGASW